MHDIGKMGIDENILNKAERLSIHEWKEIMKHPEIGYDPDIVKVFINMVM